jgi:hypothetical protein
MPQLSYQVAWKIVGLHQAFGWGKRLIRRRFHEDGELAPCGSAVLHCLNRWRAGEDPRGTVRTPDRVSPAHWLILQRALDEQPAYTVEEQIELLRRRTHKVYERSAVVRCLREHNYTWKKLTFAARQKDLFIRRDYIRLISDLLLIDPELAAFLDESHFQPEMPRLYGWGPKGRPITVYRIFGGDHAYSLLAATNVNGFIRPACLLVDTAYTAVDGDCMEKWVSASVCYRRCVCVPLGWIRSTKHILRFGTHTFALEGIGCNLSSRMWPPGAPLAGRTLTRGTARAWQARTCLLPHLGNYSRREPNSIVVLDNARVHTHEFIRLIRSVGTRVIFLPPYSPEYSVVQMHAPAVTAALKSLAPIIL